MNRRRYLATISAGAGVGLAGCSERRGGLDDGSGGPGGDSFPDYQRLLSAESIDGEGAGFFHIDLVRAKEAGFFQTSTDTETPTPTPESRTEESLSDDPAGGLLMFPVTALFLVLIFGTTRVEGYGGIDERLGPRFDENPDVETVTFTRRTFVFGGSFDTETYTNSLPSSFDRTERRGRFTVYENSGEDPLV